MYKYYIAYGSNMNIEQMMFRCRDARIVGTGVIKDYHLVFRTHATIEPCKGAEVPVVVWAISDRDERSLDRYEGFPRYYYKDFFTLPVKITYTDMVRNITGMAYIMCDGRPILPPWDRYYDIIEEGYKAFDLDPTPLERARGEAEAAVEFADLKA